ncbi:hypothetical protein ACP70R_046279 [Stipagrostis hirtigluma subsp. patula]
MGTCSGVAVAFRSAEAEAAAPRPPSLLWRREVGPFAVFPRGAWTPCSRPPETSPWSSAAAPPWPPSAGVPPDPGSASALGCCS